MFSNRLKMLRNGKQLTQQQLAEVFELSKNTIYSWEAGERKPDIEMLIRISKYFDVTTDYLLGLTDDPQFEQPATIAARPTAGMPPISDDRLNEIIAQAVKAIRAEAAKTEKKPGD